MGQKDDARNQFEALAKFMYFDMMVNVGPAGYLDGPLANEQILQALVNGASQYLEGRKKTS